MFGKIGELAGMMQRMSEMQSKMKQIKKDLEMLDVTGTDGNGVVRITITGDMSNVKSVVINDSVSGASLENAVGEAVANAIQNAKMESARRLSEVTGGIDLSALGLQ